MNMQNKLRRNKILHMEAVLKNQIIYNCIETKLKGSCSSHVDCLESGTDPDK